MAAALPPWSPQPVPATTPLGPAPDAGPPWPGSLRRPAAAIRASLRRDSGLDAALPGGTPMTSIMAMLRTVEQRGSQLGRRKVIDYATPSLQQAARLNNMIDQLLAG